MEHDGFLGDHGDYGVLDGQFDHVATPEEYRKRLFEKLTSELAKKNAQIARLKVKCTELMRENQELKKDLRDVAPTGTIRLALPEGAEPIRNPPPARLALRLNQLTESEVNDFTSMKSRTIILALADILHKAGVKLGVNEKSLAIEDQIFLTLFKLWSGEPYSRLAVYFGISKTTAWRCFNAMLPLLHDFLFVTSIRERGPSNDRTKRALPGKHLQEDSTLPVDLRLLQCANRRTQTRSKSGKKNLQCLSRKQHREIFGGHHAHRSHWLLL